MNEQNPGLSGATVKFAQVPGFPDGQELMAVELHVACHPARFPFSVPLEARMIFFFSYLFLNCCREVRISAPLGRL